ncbi:DUF385 domain-containing protein [Nocardia yunnanensis]|uniref:DUF385 domain-containing protein n=2 Tax=Nocardia yunnanensis TaxID=2382165 RepID=A0A386ZCQ2_9NOCA|nr:DUF385 domain-containing protein [Nocardia yunnanensis]
MRALAHVNRRVTNPLFRVAATRLPGYGNVVHRGRRSGRRFRTPVGLTWHDDELLIALNYGTGSDWVRNVLAAKAFQLEHRGRTILLDAPEIAERDGRPFLRARRTSSAGGYDLA